MTAAATESIMPSSTGVDCPTSFGWRREQYHCIEVDDSSESEAVEVPPAKRQRYNDDNENENPFDLIRQDNHNNADMLLTLRPRPFPRTVSLLNNNTTSTLNSSVSIYQEYTAALKYQIDYSVLLGAPQPQSNNGTPQRGVYFLDTVSIKEIPSHRDCSWDDRNRIWTSQREIQVNAERNELEFTADGDDWEKCTEEHDFMLWETSSTTSELVHPFTYEKLQREREQWQQGGSRGQKRAMDDGAPLPLRTIAKVSSFRDLSKLGECSA